MTKKKHKSDVSETLHEMAAGLHKAGFMDETTMRTFEASCLVADEAMTPKKIKALRRKVNVSQAVFAAYLNVKPDTVSKWEQGRGKPTGPATRLLTVIQRHGLDVLVA